MKATLLLFVSLLGAQQAYACELAGGPAETVIAPGHKILYRASPRVGAHFSLDFVVCPPPEAVRVDASMPAHRHGMNYQPSIVSLGEGRYRADGLMFHMPGDWQLLFEIRSGGTMERVTRDLHVE